MADGRIAGQPIDDVAARKGVTDEPKAAFRMEALAIEGDDAGGLLAPVLQRMQTERRDGRGVGMAENAEDAAFFAQPVSVEIGEGCFSHDIGPPAWSMRHALGFEQLLHSGTARPVITQICAVVGPAAGGFVDVTALIRWGIGGIGVARTARLQLV